MQHLKTLFATAFTDLSFLKRWMVRLAVAGLLGGAALKGLSLFQGDDASDWSSFSFRTGLGYLLGFLVGVAVRIFLKLSMLVGLGMAALGYALQKIGWIDLPWDSFGDISHAFGKAIEHNTQALQDFLSGYLPAGASTAVGVGSGITQKPSFDDDDDDDDDDD